MVPTSEPISRKVPGSNSRFMRWRTSSLPRECMYFSTRSGPPMAAPSVRRRSSSSNHGFHSSRLLTHQLFHPW